MNFSLLMTPGHIGKLELKNRFIMAPMGHGFCDEDECYVNDRLIEFFRQRALGGYALIDVGAVQIDPLLHTGDAAPDPGRPRSRRQNHGPAPAPGPLLQQP